MTDVERRLSELMAFGAYRGGALAARFIPGIAAGTLAAPIGVGAAFASRSRREMIMRHLQRVDPHLRGAALRRAAVEAFDYYARYWLESFRLPYLSTRAVERGLTTQGYDEYVLGGLAANKGVILALPHLGGWEWAGRWLADRGHGVTAVVERIEPPELFDWFAELRAELGMNVVPLGPDAGREVLAALARNDVVCLLCDRDIARTGIEVDFFGERTTLPAGPAMLALRSGAPLLPTAVYFSNRGTDHHLGIVRPPLDTERCGGRLRADIDRVTGDLAAELERLIAAAPSQWHMFQPNWPSDPGY